MGSQVLGLTCRDARVSPFSSAGPARVLQDAACVHASLPSALAFHHSLLQRSCEEYRKRQEEGRWDPSVEVGRFKDNREFNVGVMGLGESRRCRVNGVR